MGVQGLERRWEIVAVTGAIGILALAGVVLAWWNQGVPDQQIARGATAYAVTVAAIGVVVFQAGSVVAGRIYLAASAMAAVSGAAAAYASSGVGRRDPLPGAEWMVAPVLLLLPALALPIVVGGMLVPSGTLPTDRWRLVAYAAIAGSVTFVVASLLRPGPIPDFDVASNPYGIDGASGPAEALTGLSILVVTACLVASMIRLVIRHRAAVGLERQQLRLVGFGTGVALICVVAAQFLGAPPTVHVVALALVPLTTGAAILRFRLWDADVLISRSLVYLMVCAGLALVYVGAVVALGVSFGSEAELGAALIATACVAAALQPLRTGANRLVARWLFGQRDDPFAMLLRFDADLRRASPDDPLQALVAVVAEALRLPFVEVISTSTGRSARAGAARPGEEMLLPVSDGSQVIGEMRFGSRSQGERFTSEERRLFGHVALQAGAILRTVELSDSLRTANEQLIDSRRAEREALRHDLHDTIGPSLAAVLLRLRDASDSLDDPRAAAEILSRADGMTRAAIEDVRRVSRDLQPAPLDSLGLAEATPALADQLSTGKLPIEVWTSGDLASLPPSMATAIFQIASEALTNVVRHSGATSCVVRLVHTDRAVVEVCDDGTGLPSSPEEGVGMRSMRRRVEELGGTWTTERNGDHGTTIRATFVPVPA